MDFLHNDKQQMEQRMLIRSVTISIVLTLLILCALGFWAYSNRSAILQSFAQQYLDERQAQGVTEGETNFNPLSQEAAIVGIVEMTNPAVVSVVVTKDVPVIENFFEEFSPFGGRFGDEFNFRVPSRREVGTEKREVGGGSGFFVSPDGLIVTNRHVVDDESAEYSVLTNSGKSYEVEVVARDAFLDIAILQVKDDPPEEYGGEFQYLTFGDSDALKQGQTTIAIGNALGEFRNSVSVGIISGLSRSIIAGDNRGVAEALEEVIQTDAAINQGNSGGPLLDSRGNVIGVNVAVAARSENIGFALPGNVVADIVESIKQYGEIVRPFLGVRFTMVNERIADQEKLDIDYGALIIPGDTPMDIAVLPDSAADRAGIQTGDVIIEINGVSLRERTLGSVIRNQTIGEAIPIVVVRDGEEVTLTVILDRAPE